MFRTGRILTDRAGFALDILKAKFLKRYKPFQVQFSITNRCNLRCSYCYANYPERGQKDLSTEEIFNIIDQLKDIGTKRINLVGGEPLIRKDIEDIIDHIKSKNIECAMTSNGYFVPKKIDAVKKLDLLCISMDGGKEANDANRGEGSFEKAMEAIKTAKENRVPLQVATVITKNNFNSIEYMLEKGNELGFTIGFSTLINQTVNGEKKTPLNMISDMEYKQVLGKLIQLKEEGAPILFSRKTLEYALNWKYGYERDKIIGEMPDSNIIKCNAGRFFCIIDVNGDVYPCPVLVDVIKPKNALKDGLRESFRHINDHKCRTCHIPCQNEFNLMYSFNIGVIMNIARNYKRSQQ